MHPLDLTSAIWAAADCDPLALEQLRFSNTAAQLPSVFPVGALAAATIGAQALAAAEVWRMRGGGAQTVDIDQRHALAMFRSERYVKADGQALPDPWSPIAGYYQAGDGRWIQLHTNFEHHRDGVLRVLECEDNRASVAAAIAQWNAAELDARLAQEGMCAALIRSPQEWAATEQAQAVAKLPLFDIERVADAPPAVWAPAADTAAPAGGAATRAGYSPRPLSGVRVLDLSRVIAAPVAGRTLAQHGADLLAVSAAHLPNLPALVVDTGRGKRSTQLDLRDPAQHEQLRQLIREADIFLHAYRPGALAARGFSTEELQRLRPGLIEVQLCAYSHAGPWSERRGFDSLVQSASGIAWESALAAGVAQPDGQPGKLPCQALDHATGYLAALVAMVALQRRAQEGGGWRARVSLAQTGHWLQSLPRVEGGMQHPELTPEEMAPWMQSIPSSFGMVHAVAPVEVMSATPARFDRPPAPLDAHAPRWDDI
jgi:crotonobetainyl-CoA:carnitine CoA-transferase CaiB-like acyl-CoA transferase